MMADRPDTWMPLYIADYLKDTQDLSPAEHGAYFLLLMDAWTRGGILPAESVRLQRISRMSDKEWKSSATTILGFFHLTDAGYRHSRVDRELARADGFVAQRSAAGKASAEARKKQREGQRNGNGRSTEDATKGQRNGKPIPSPSQEPNGSSSVDKSTGENADFSPDPDKAFWDNAKAYLSRNGIPNPGAMIGKWIREQSKADTAAALTQAQIERAVEPIPFVQGYFRKRKASLFGEEEDFRDRILP